MRCWAQEWTESERGWGKRPDGYTLHKSKEDIKAFLDAMRAREAEQYKGATPDEYSYPEGKATLVEVTDEEVITALKNSQCGIWGPGRNPPPALAEAEELVDPPSPALVAFYKLRQIEEDLHEALNELTRPGASVMSPAPIPALQGDDHS